MLFAHITLATRDVRASADFFSQALGWSEINRPGNIRQRAAWLRIAPDQELHLLEVAGFEPSPFEEEYGRHFAFVAPLGQFPQIKERLARHGAELIPPKRPTPFERFFFKDPINGYIFEIIEAEHKPEA